ncbi:MAG: adenylate/guanylate cyclase domain-containing protein [Verrucomicrobiales bacterium]|nr:adenylate/guanylate cyclase domain-containing protein [Verrucomicrobiales bacterium]
MPASLTDAASGKVYQLDNITKLGRSTSCEIQLNDPRVSRQHAMVRLEDDALWLYDLGSFNGSSVNGRRIISGYRLRGGDSIGIADFQLRFHQDGLAYTTIAEAGLDKMRTIALVKTVPAIVLVSDIKGFTKLSESLPPEDVARTVGKWYADCEKIVSAAGGTIDKFIGDAVLAHWLQPAPGARAKALAAAQELTRSLSETPGNTDNLECCAALHLGDVAYGGMGGGELTMLGDTVNTTFRLEDLTRKLDRPILLSYHFLDGWAEAPATTTLGPQKLKGRKEPVQVYHPT